MTVEGGSATGSIPITIHESLFYAPVGLNGKQQMAQLDTGGADVMVAERISQGLEVVKEGKMLGAFGQAETKVVKLPALSWLGKTYRNLPATLRPNPSETTPFPVNMTLGNAVLLAQPLYLDLRMMEVCSVAPQSHLQVAETPMRLDHGIPFVDLTMGGRKVHALFDTGAGSSCLNARLTDLRGSEILSHEVVDPTGASMALKLHRGPALSLGGLDLGAPEYFVLDLTRQETLLGSPIDFIIGTNTMLRAGGVWRLDAKTGRLGWV